MNTVEITVAERTYTVTPLPIRKNREWRSRFDPILKDLSGFVGELATYAGEDFVDAPNMINRLAQGLSGHIPMVTSYLVQSLDMIADAVFDYAPEMAKDREYIEANGYDEELVGAFVRLLPLAYPFGPAVQGLVNRIPSGPTEPLTEQNSPTASSE